MGRFMWHKRNFINLFEGHSNMHKINLFLYLNNFFAILYICVDSDIIFFSSEIYSIHETIS